MPRKQDPISRIINDYASLDSAGRSQVEAALRGFRIGSGGSTGTTARRAPITPRVSKPSVGGVLSPTSDNNN